MTSTLTDPNAVVCPKCDGQMWDNRKDKKNPKAPDFKCRDRSCDGVIWPAKGKPANGKPPVQYPSSKPQSEMPALLRDQEAEDAAELQSKIGEPEKVKLAGIYLEATQFVLEKVVPLYEQKEIGLTDQAVASMVATLFIAKSKER